VDALLFRGVLGLAAAASPLLAQTPDSAANPGNIPKTAQPNPEKKGVQNPKPATLKLTVQVVPNLIRFDTKRFDVSAGGLVEVTLKNGCIVPHNIVFLDKEAEPGVIAGVNAMGVEGMSRNYVPEVPGILAASKLLQPKGAETVKFKAPMEPGDYLFLCTFPGHWFTMRGTMRVRPVGEPLTPPDREKIKDNSVPDALKESGISHLPSGTWEKPLVLRSFLPDPGLGDEFFAHHGVGKDAVKYDPNTRLDVMAKEKDPATGQWVEKPVKIPSLAGVAAPVAVSFGKDFSFAWDTTECRLLYAWRGGFLDMNPYWGKEPGGVRPKVYLPGVVGELVYLASGPAPVRAPGNPGPAFEGYRMTASGPEFFYRLGDRRITERVVPRRSGSFEWEVEADGSGIELVLAERDRAVAKVGKTGGTGWLVEIQDRVESVRKAGADPSDPAGKEKPAQKAE
jgi:azurin